MRRLSRGGRAKWIGGRRGSAELRKGLTREKDGGAEVGETCSARSGLAAPTELAEFHLQAEAQALHERGWQTKSRQRGEPMVCGEAGPTRRRSTGVAGPVAKSRDTS